MRFGVVQARRAWLTANDVLNTLPPDAFILEMQRHLRREVTGTQKAAS
jgi:hypothetical protein